MATETQPSKPEEVSEKKRELKIRFSWQWARRPIQIATFILFFGGLLGLGSWPLIIPALDCLGVEWKAIGCAFGVLQNSIYTKYILWAVLASFLLIGVILGRAFCAWICPFGFVMDLVKMTRRKRSELSARTHETLKDLKYAALFGTLLFTGVITGTLILSPALSWRYVQEFGDILLAPFCVLCPAGTLFALVPRFLEKIAPMLSPSYIGGGLGMQNLFPFLTRIAILVILLVAVFYIPRFWCRYVCPVGALMGLINHFSYLGLKRDIVKCIKCRTCVEKCPMRVPILDLPWEKFTHPECTMCMECVDACEEGAIKLKFP